MRPGTTSMRTEDLQNSLTGRCGVGRCLCWSSGGGVHCTGNEASLTNKVNVIIVRGISLDVNELSREY